MDRLLDELGVLSATLKRVSDQTERDPAVCYGAVNR